MHCRISLSQIWIHDQVLVQNHNISLKSLMLAKLNADWKSESTAPLDWNLSFSQDPKDLLIANKIFVFQYSPAVGDWLVTNIRLPYWLMCNSNKPLRDVFVGYWCMSWVCCKGTAWTPRAFHHLKGLPKSLVMHTLACLIATRICLIQISWNLPFIENYSYKKNVKYLEEVYGNSPCFVFK